MCRQATCLGRGRVVALFFPSLTTQLYRPLNWFRVSFGRAALDAEGDLNTLGAAGFMLRRLGLCRDALAGLMVCDFGFRVVHILMAAAAAAARKSCHHNVNDRDDTSRHKAASIIFGGTHRTDDCISHSCKRNDLMTPEAVHQQQCRKYHATLNPEPWLDLQRPTCLGLLHERMSSLYQALKRYILCG